MKTLYVSDLDGTLLTPEKKISGASADILNQLIQKGVLFTVATARSPATACEVLSNLNLELPGILLNGAVLYDFQNRRFAGSAPMSYQAAAEALTVYRQAGRLPFLYTLEDDEICVSYERFGHQAEERFCRERKGKAYKRFEQRELFLTPEDVPIYFTMMDEKEIVEPLYRRIQRIPGLKAAFYRDNYEDVYFLEVFSSQASKSLAVRRMKESLGADRVVAFGDNGNDVDMLLAADVGCAVGNAAPAAKAAADRIIGANTEDGVAEYLKPLMDKM